MKLSLSVININPNGVIIYRGPSRLNGKPIVVVATGLKHNSENDKTGDMVQTFILADNEKPLLAIYNGKDEAVCGDCPHRYVNGAGTCYVNATNGPSGVMRAIQNESYQQVTPEQASELVAGRVVRLGSYGDPVAVPLAVWDALLSKAAGWTGYTHQWRKSLARGFNRYCMASVETPKQTAFAKRRGWRWYRIRENEDDPLLPGEMMCPASKEGGKRLTCQQCGACSGGDPRKASPAIIAHGTNWKKNRLVRVIKALKQKKRLRFN
jgi:hypothetical protein